MTCIDPSKLSDIELHDAIALLRDEQKKRQIAADRKLIEDFKRAANALAEASISYYIGYQGEDIYLGGAEDYHFEY